MADAADNATVTQFSKCQEYSIEDVVRLVFLQIRTSSRLFGCCRSKTWRITSRIGACQACLHLMFMFTDVCVCKIRCREVNEACQCACPDGIAPSAKKTWLMANNQGTEKMLPTLPLFFILKNKCVSWLSRANYTDTLK